MTPFMGGLLDRTRRFAPFAQVAMPRKRR